MERYEKYKDSGVEWIGEIPEGWEVKKIKYLATEELSIFTDGDWIESKDIVFDENQIRYITTGNIGEGKYKEQGHTYITDEKFTKLNCTEILPDDLLISRLNPPIGRSCILPDLGSRVVTSVDNVVLRPDKLFNKKFLMYAMSNCRYFEYTSLIARGATMQRISRGLLGNVPLTISGDIDTQTAIANYLDRKTAEIDELIAQKERLIALYEEEKTAIINQALTKGIDPDVRLKDSGIEWLGEIPEGWEVSRIKKICSVRQGLQISISERNVIQVENSLPYITIKAINNPDDAKEYIENPSNNVVCGKDDILVARTGATGEIITGIEGVFHNNFFLVDYDRKQIVKSYLVNFLRSQRIKEYLLLVAGTTTIPDLNHNDFYNTPFFVLSFEQQTAIVNHIESETARINAKIAKTKKIIALQKEYRTALISEVVTGKIKVTEETAP